MTQKEKLIEKMLKVADKYVLLIEKTIDAKIDAEMYDAETISESAKALYCFVASIRKVALIDEESIVKCDFVQSKVEKLISDYEHYATEYISRVLKMYPVPVEDIEAINRTMYYLKSAMSTLSIINLEKNKREVETEQL